MRPPNPVWLREMRAAMRLGRTPIAIATLTTLTTLIVVSAGGIASENEPPARVGTGLYHTFFSLAFALVCWVGPGVAAVTIASERSGHTWEALVLTGLSPRVIARGKFFASLTYIALYLVALAPVGAVPFLFGGVTAAEVLAAYALLGLLACLAVGFGLSVSSALSSPGLAAVVTLPLAVALSMIAYGFLGVGLSFVAHELWPGVVQGAPIWLPTAYARAPLSMEYLVYLVVIPVGSIVLFGWFFFENTVANLRDPNDDRVGGLKRWFLGTVLALSIMVASVAAVVPSDPGVAVLIGLGFVSTFLLLTLLLLSGDALAPSPRVVATWERESAGVFKKMLGPGIVGTNTLVLGAGLVSISALSLTGVLLERAQGTSFTSEEIGAVIVVACYASAFFVFLGGLATWIRALVDRPISVRLLLLLATFVGVVGPWLVLAMSGAVFQRTTDTLIIASPSPVYAAVMIDALGSAADSAHEKMIAGISAMIAWTVSGLVLFAMGARAVMRRGGAERARREAMSQGNAVEPSEPAT